jgi:hypothetical protein
VRGKDVRGARQQYHRLQVLQCVVRQILDQRLVDGKTVGDTGKRVPSVDLAAASTPMTVPAPGRFSTSTWRPSDFGISCAIIRTVVSIVLPPGGNGTMMRTGRTGQAGVCAHPFAAPRVRMIHARVAVVHLAERSFIDAPWSFDPRMTTAVNPNLTLV